MRTRGFHHVILTVSNVARSTAFYHAVLGLEVLEESGTVSVLGDGDGLLCLRLPPGVASPGDRFDENRLGLDHVAFAVDESNALDETLIALTALGVQTAGIEFDPDGKAHYVCFRDPDNIQVEVYTRTEYSIGRAALRDRGLIH